MRRIFSPTIVLITLFALTGITHVTLIDMEDGTIYNTDLQLTWLKDAGMGGLRNWYDALNWADNLVFAGFDNWRLPIAVTNPEGQNITTYNMTESELGHLYYTELGNAPALGGEAPPLNPALFINLEQRAYW